MSIKNCKFKVFFDRNPYIRKKFLKNGYYGLAFNRQGDGGQLGFVPISPMKKTMVTAQNGLN